MDITPVLSETKQLIQRYGSGAFTIAGVEYSSSVLVFPERTLPWSVTSFADIMEASFEPVIFKASEVEILILGCGKTQAFVAPELRESLKRHGIILDSMDTGAACRTFNILLAEERRVAAALIAL